MKKSRRDNLYHMLTHHHQKIGMEYYGNSTNFCGTLMSGKDKSEYNASFDDFLAYHKEVRVERRNMLAAVDHDEEE